MQTTDETVTSPTSPAELEALIGSSEGLVESSIDTPQVLVEDDHEQNSELVGASQPATDMHLLEQVASNFPKTSEPGTNHHTILEPNFGSEQALELNENAETGHVEHSLEVIDLASSSAISEINYQINQPAQSASLEAPAVTTQSINQPVSPSIGSSDSSSQSPAPRSSNPALTNKADFPALESKAQTQEPVQPSPEVINPAQAPLPEKSSGNVATTRGFEAIETLSDAQSQDFAEPIQIMQEPSSLAMPLVKAEDPMDQNPSLTERTDGVLDDRPKPELPLKHSSPQPEVLVGTKSTDSDQAAEPAATQAPDLSPADATPPIPQAPTNVTINPSTSLESPPVVEVFRPHRVVSRPPNTPVVPAPQPQTQVIQPKPEAQSLAEEQSSEQAISLFERLKATWPRATDAPAPHRPTPSLPIPETGHKPILKLFKRLEQTWPSAQSARRIAQDPESSQAADLEAELTTPSGPVGVWAYTGRLPGSPTFDTNPFETENSSLSHANREFLQPLLGFDPQLAKVYRGPASDQLNLAYRADALNLGSAVVLGSWVGTDSPEMLGLLAHELTHLARQQNPRFVPPVLASVSPLDGSEEGLAQQVEQAVAQQADPESLEGSFGGLPTPWQPLPSWLAATRNESESGTGFETSLPSARDSALTSAQVSSPSSFTPIGSAATGGSVGVQTASQDRSPQEVSPGGPLPARSAEAEANGVETPPNLDALAEEVYAVLKRRLSEERRRR